jgi:hypothetical protein
MAQQDQATSGSAGVAGAADEQDSSGRVVDQLGAAQRERKGGP